MSVRRLPEAVSLTDLFRNALLEVVDAASVYGQHPVEVSPCTTDQLAAVLRVCAHHRVSWSFACCAEITPGEFDVVLSLALLGFRAQRAPRTDAH